MCKNGKRKRNIKQIERPKIIGVVCPNIEDHQKMILGSFCRKLSEDSKKRISDVFSGKKNIEEIKAENDDETNMLKKLYQEIVALIKEYSGMYLESSNLVCGICFKSVSILDELVSRRLAIDENNIHENEKVLRRARYDSVRKFVIGNEEARNYFEKYFKKSVPVRSCTSKDCVWGKYYLMGETAICDKCFRIIPNIRPPKKKIIITRSSVENNRNKPANALQEKIPPAIKENNLLIYK